VNGKYNRAVVYAVVGGDQPKVSYHGVESKDLVLSPSDAVKALRQYGFTEAYVEITNTSANSEMTLHRTFLELKNKLLLLYRAPTPVRKHHKINR